MAQVHDQRTTTKGKWWLGRKLTLRIHLGAFLLQWLYNLTDRQVEWALKDNAAYQLFCGRGLIDPWHAPDHTKIEEFRSRLSPETQRQMANVVAVWATELGFADPSAMDIDSTVQEANIAYPSDAHLMVKMTLLVHKVWTYMKQHISFFADFIGVPVANVQETTTLESTVTTVGENEGLHPHIRWTKTPDFVYVYHGISPMNRVFILTFAVCLATPTQARKVFQRDQ
jgi:Transposase domain (DUF772)